jgi:hypothetical protein
MLYRLSTVPATANFPTITGRNLAHVRRTAVEKAFIAASFHFNRLTLIDPTIKQSALLAGVSIPYVAAAIALVFRKAVLQQRALHAVNTAVEPFGDRLKRATPEELLEAARVLGPDRVLHSMVALLV